MNDLLLDLPSDVRIKLIAALESGYLDLQPSVTQLRAALGRVEQADALVEALGALNALGMSPRGAAVALQAIDRVAARQRKPDLVLSGLQIPGVFARDTLMVFDELLRYAERSVWMSSFVYHNGPKVFETLARRMEEQPQLAVKLLLNIQRRWGDSSASEQIVSTFAATFWKKAWPGARRPQVYYDPRSIAGDTAGGEAAGTAVLHAKAVVVDDEALFITSANLTEAASERNIEMGVLLRDRSMALSVVLYFRRLIDSGHLRLVPG